MGEFFDTTQYGEDYDGVVPIYRPTGQARGRIFALHGLGGHWRTTWTQPVASPVKDIFWLESLLPYEFGDCEISSIAWRPDLSDDGIKKIAEKVREFVVNAVPQTHAPIIFIIHSLGIFEMLLRLLWPPYPEMSNSTIKLDPLIGIIFLGSPHIFKQPQDHYRKFFPASVRGILDTRTKESGDLSFELIAHIMEERPVKIISFFEQPMQSPGHFPVFTREEVTRKNLGEHEIMSVAKSHFDLAKFTSSTDASFLQLCSGLKIMLDHWVDLDKSLGMFLRPLKSLHEELLIEKGRVAYESRRGINIFPQLGSWVHFPANNTEWIERAWWWVWKEYKVLYSWGLKFDFPGTVLQARSNFPTSRFLLPSASCTKLESELGPIMHLNIFLPYLHWDTLAGAKAYTNFLRQRHRFEITHPHPLSAFEHLPGSFESYHPRRTLDQYYYSRLEDTTERDNDQVVSKQTSDAPGGARMIMVDQLWLGLWLSPPQLKDNQMEETSTIVTSFPFTAYARPGTLDHDQYSILDIQEKVLRAIRSRIKQKVFGVGVRKQLGAVDVAVEVLTNALTSMLSFREDLALNFLELFREALNKVTEDHRKFLRTFVASMSYDTKRITKSLKTEKFHLELQKECRLSLEIADIIGELHMLRRLLRSQIYALRKAQEEIERVLSPDTPQKVHSEAITPLSQKIFELSKTIENDYLYQVNEMIEDADRAQKDILNHLDLQQKQDHIDEVHSSNQTALLTAKQAMSSQDQTDATNAQSWILFIFTLVTIVFLPLSFLTSYYGMNVSDHNNDQVFRKTSYIWKVMGGSTFPTLTLLLIGGGTFFFWSRRRAIKNRIKDLAFLEKNDALPPLLFKDDDPMYLEIKQQAEEMRKQDQIKKPAQDQATRHEGEKAKTRQEVEVGKQEENKTGTSKLTQTGVPSRDNAEMV